MSTLATKIESGIAHLELHRPEVRNALNLEMVRELHSTLDDLAPREELRALVFSGAGGKAFASGADISELRERTHREAIAAIEGYALGGGLELALACDLRVGAKTAKLGLPEVSLGIYPAAGGTWRLPRLVGLGRAKELVFTGRIVDGTEAYALGILERLCESGQALKTALELAGLISQNASLAVQVAKVSLNAAARGGPPSPVERLGQGLLFDSAEKRQRMTAFLEKRGKK